MTEGKIIIVDDNDNPIGLKWRNEIDYSTDRYRWSSVWIENSNGEVLLAQRAFTKDKDPGKWGPAVAGTIEEGETYESNAYKEAEEEIGLVGIKLELGPKMKADHPRRHFGQMFLCTVDKSLEEFKLQEEEVEQIKWIPKDELRKDIQEHPENYVPAMPKIIGVLI